MTDQELRYVAIVCFVNAYALHYDAVALSNLGSNARAFSIACTGAEELAKVRVCIGLLEKDKNFHAYRKQEKFWRFWRDHQVKVAMGLLSVDIDFDAWPRDNTHRLFAEQHGAYMVKLYEEAMSAHQETEEMAEFVKIAREDGLYVDVVLLKDGISIKDPQSISASLLKSLRRAQ